MFAATRRPTEAVVYYERAISLRPDLAQAHWNLSLALHLMGNFPHGWNEYEWRQKTPELAGEGKSFTSPLWNGEGLQRKTILLHVEKCFGGAVQFIRYALLVPSFGGHILFKCKPALKRLFKGVKRFIKSSCEMKSYPTRFPFSITEPTIPAPHS